MTKCETACAYALGGLVVCGSAVLGALVAVGYDWAVGLAIVVIGCLVAYVYAVPDPYRKDSK